jgi:hypothetical protein
VDNPDSPRRPAPDLDDNPASAQDRRAGFVRLFRNARREAVIVAAVWFLALAWTVGYCTLRGYRHPPRQPLGHYGTGH